MQENLEPQRNNVEDDPRVLACFANVSELHTAVEWLAKQANASEGETGEAFRKLSSLLTPDNRMQLVVELLTENLSGNEGSYKALGQEAKIDAVRLAGISGPQKAHAMFQFMKLVTML